MDRMQAPELTDSIISNFSNSIESDDKEKQILEKTKRITIALYRDNAGETRPRFIALLEGEGYPSFTSSFAFTFSSAWEKIKTTGGNYWKAKNTNIFLAMNPKKLFISDMPLFNSGQKTDAPRIRTDFQNNTFAYGWMPEAAIVSALLNSFGIPLNLPANGLLFTIRPNDYGYEMSLGIEMQSASIAKAAAGMLIIAKNSMTGAVIPDPRLQALAGLFFANSPRVEGNALLITTGVMDERQLTGLLLFFLLQ